MNENIKKVIQKLKIEGIYLKYNKQGHLDAYISKQNHSVPFNQIYNCYKSLITRQEWDEHKAYIRSSLDIIQNLSFSPGSPKLIDAGLGTKKLNTYNAFVPGSNEQQCSLFYEFLERLFPEEHERHTFTQWIAHMIQHPSERPSWGVMLTGEQGTGKGILFHKVLTPLLCNQTKVCSTYDDFLGRHSEALNGSMLVLLDDVKTDSRKTATRLKTKMDAPKVTINPKFEQPYTLQVYSRIILASNEISPIPLGPEDTRRWFVPSRLKHMHSAQETQAFIKRLVKWLEQPLNLDRVFNFLKEYDLKGFNPNFINPTDTLSFMVNSNESVLTTEINEWLEKNPVFQWSSLKLIFPGYSDQQLKKAIIEIGYQSVISNIDNSGRKRWWIPVGCKPSRAKEIYLSNSHNSF